MGAEKLEMRLKMNNLSASQIQKLTSSKVQVAKDEHGLQATVRNHLCMAAKGRTFLASFMRTVDLKLGHFLHSCANAETIADVDFCLLYTSPSPRD